MVALDDPYSSYCIILLQDIHIYVPHFVIIQRKCPAE
jgi:hypothetical protein